MTSVTTTSKSAKPTARLLKIILIVVLAAVVAIGTLPHYFSGKWPWAAYPPTALLKQVKAVRETPLEVTGWQVTSAQKVSVGDHDWQHQNMLLAGQAEPSANQPNQINHFELLLLPQPSHKDQPAVELLDVVALNDLKADSYQDINIPITGLQDQSPSSIKIRFLRGIGDQQTYAIAQWYAWPNGGSYAPGDWFWVDLRSQWLTRQRTPWLSVSLFVPIEPVGRVRDYRDAVIQISQTVQASLISGPMARPSPAN